MKNQPSLTSINDYLKKLVSYLQKPTKDNPYRMIIESFIGKRKGKLEKTIRLPGFSQGPRVYNGEYNYSPQLNTLKKYGVVVDDGCGKLIIDPRFHSILKTKKYKPVGYLSKQKRIELERQLKKLGVNEDMTKVILDNIDTRKSLAICWKNMPRRENDESYPQTYSTFCRKVRTYQKALGYLA